MGEVWILCSVDHDLTRQNGAPEVVAVAGGICVWGRGAEDKVRGG